MVLAQRRDICSCVLYFLKFLRGCTLRSVKRMMLVVVRSFNNIDVYFCNPLLRHWHRVRRNNHRLRILKAWLLIPSYPFCLLLKGLFRLVLFDKICIGRRRIKLRHIINCRPLCFRNLCLLHLGLLWMRVLGWWWIEEWPCVDRGPSRIGHEWSSARFDFFFWMWVVRRSKAWIFVDEELGRIAFFR